MNTIISVVFPREVQVYCAINDIQIQELLNLGISRGILDCNFISNSLYRGRYSILDGVYRMLLEEATDRSMYLEELAGLYILEGFNRFFGYL